jgi:hypothetical protein
LYFYEGRTDVTNTASATIDVRCGYCVGLIAGFRGVRTDPIGTSDDSKLTGFGRFGPSDKVFDWMPDRLAEGPTCLVALRVDYPASVLSPRWHCVIVP